MSEEEFEAVSPHVLDWIVETVATHAPQARPVASLGFKRLPLYFPAKLLATTKVVVVDVVPKPRLADLGLSQFSEFDEMPSDGITYSETFFVQNNRQRDEAIYFHELVHVIQWSWFGPKRFLAAYADGLERIYYRHSPLEVMAYTLESVFKNSDSPFDVVAVVQEQLRDMYP
jgi:hypothetical protein